MYVHNSPLLLTIFFFNIYRLEKVKRTYLTPTNVAIVASETLSALAVVRALRIVTRPSILTRRTTALIDVCKFIDSFILTKPFKTPYTL